MLGTTAIAGFVAPVHAQESGESLEEVRVTGSRILRRDLDATSPLVTINSDTFENSSNVALETQLNKLPQFVPAITQFVTTDVQNSAVNTIGASTINLRGLGANRTLVLLDGRRAMPVNASLVVDINSIPSAAIKRVEVISGGASSAYGADAVAGVVNFILKNDFEGMEFDTQYGMTELGDDQELRISGLMGGNFSDNRGNAMFGVEYYKRGTAQTGERDFYTKGWADPSTAGTEPRLSVNYYSPSTDAAQQPLATAVNSIFTQGPAVPRNGNFYFNDNGTLFANTAANGAGLYRYNGVIDNRFRTINQSGALKENTQTSLVSIPEDRYSMFGRADYDILDKLSFFIQGNFTKTHTRSTLAYSPATAGWSVLIPRDADHPVPTELATLLDSRPGAFAGTPWQLNLVADFAGPRSSVNDTQTYQVLAGLNGQLPFRDWTWEAYASHGNTEVTNGLFGFISLARYRALVLQPNYGKNATITGNQGLPGNGFAAATVHCTSGLPVFGDTPVTQDCIDAITANMQNVTNMDQDIVEANTQGGLFDLPAGELRAAAGVDYRKNTFAYVIDPLAANSSFVDSPVGIFPSASTRGETEVKEAFAELIVPILSDLPAFKKLNLELGYRFSDYDTAGNVDTYKAIVDWNIIDSVRFRGGYQRANRAPNIGELFLPPTQGVVQSGTGDPCATNSTAVYGASSTRNPNFAAVRAFCSQIMGAGAAAAFYNPATQPVGTPVTNQLLTTQGNVNLQSETADTVTAGFVFRPTFQSPLLNKITASIDYYSIKIENSIATLSFDAIYNQCLNPANNTTQDVNNRFCQLITRDPSTGQPANALGTYLNAGTLKTAGIDFNFDWSADLADMGLGNAPGALSFNLATTYLDKFEAQDLPGSPVIDYSGSIGGLDTRNTGQFRFKTFTTVGYTVGGISGSLRWRHLPSAHSLAYAQAQAQNATTPLEGPSHYDVVDLTGRWELNQTYQVRFGVENLLDKDPEITNYNPTPGATFSSGQGITQAGYYDVLGRRYFVGFKARF